MTLLALENINNANPSKNHKTERYLCFVILNLPIYFIKISMPIVKLLKCFSIAPVTYSHSHMAR
jgi:hypothetical protein